MTQIKAPGVTRRKTFNRAHLSQSGCDPLPQVRYSTQASDTRGGAESGIGARLSGGDRSCSPPDPRYPMTA